MHLPLIRKRCENEWFKESGESSGSFKEKGLAEGLTQGKEKVDGVESVSLQRGQLP